MDDHTFSEMPVFKTNILHSKAAGVRVVLHEHGTMPDMKHGFSISPGMEIEVIILFLSEVLY